LVGSVEMIEALGADTLIHVAFGGGSLIVRLPHGAPATVGEPIALAAAPGRVYLFDAESGARMAST
jgi:ABC-type sugar transport system ATPase subunit